MGADFFHNSYECDDYQKGYDELVRMAEIIVPGPYSGTIKETDGVWLFEQREFSAKTLEDAFDEAEKWQCGDAARDMVEKWGPAMCVYCKGKDGRSGYFYWGLASR